MTDRRQSTEEICSRLRDVLDETRNLGRRELLVALGRAFAGTALLSSLPGMGSRAWADEKPITAFVFGGSWKKAAMTAFGEPFTQKTGIPVQYQDPYVFAKLRAMHEAKAMQIDVVSVQGEEVFQAQRAKMIMPLDFNIIDKSVLDPRQLRHGDTIGGHVLSYCICYNKKTWPGEHHPNSWSDFWDVEKYPGRRVLRKDEVWTMEAALMADGVKESEFYPLPVDRVFRSLDRIKPHIKAWYSDNSLAQQMMEQEEVDLIAMVNGRASDSILNHNAPYEMVWNEAICEGGTEGWLAPVGCPNPVGAMKFLDLVGRAEYQAVFARLMFYGPQNRKANDLLSPELARLMPSYPANEKISHMVNFDWWSDNLRPMQRRFQIWLQS